MKEAGATAERGGSMGGDSMRRHGNDEQALEAASAGGRLVVVLGNRPDIDVRAIAARAEREDRPVLLVAPDPGTSPGQAKVLEKFARLSWSWMELLSFGLAHGLDVVRDVDEVIVAARGRERRRLVSSLRSTRRSSGDGATG
jgi:hypothetical protein